MLRRPSTLLLLLGLCAPAAACSDSGSEPAATSDGALAAAGSASVPSGAAGSGAGGSESSASTGFSPSDRSAHPSAGCSNPAMGATGARTLTSGGQEGHYVISFPPGYDPQLPATVGFVFHGANNSDVSCFGGSNCPNVQASLQDKAILVYPKSFGSSWTDATRDQNVAWFDDLLSYVKANYCVDEHKVFVMGTSSGAHFSNILGCRRSDVLRAIAPGAGERLETSGCEDTRFAALVIHGIDDGSTGTGVPFAKGEEARDFYAQRNNCSSETVPPIAQIHEEVRMLRDAAISATPRASTAGIFRCADYQGCDPGLPVRWCEHGEDGYDATTHGYPVEGGLTTWDFVSAL
jgi:poly(3-hydroxybutyrate) depolymerase